MSVLFQLLRAAIAGNTPTALSPGQIAIDEFLGKIFWRGSGGKINVLPLLAPPNTILGNNTNVTAAPTFMTAAEVNQMLSGGSLLSGVLGGLTSVTDLAKTGAFYDRAYVVVAPLTGGSVMIAASTSVQVINPAGPLGALTLVLPPLPGDGQRVEITTTQTIAALTCSGGLAALRNAPTSLGAGASVAYLYVASVNTWYRTR